MRLGKEHISFETAKIGSLVDVQDSEDPEGLRVMYYLVQDLKVSARAPRTLRMRSGMLNSRFVSARPPQCFVQSLLSLNFRIKPVG